MNFNLSSREKTFVRVFVGLAFICLALISSWWFWMPVAFIFLISTKRFPEVLAAGFITDMIYGLETSRFFGFRYVFTFAAIILMIISYFIKRILRTNFR